MRKTTIGRRGEDGVDKGAHTIRSGRRDLVKGAKLNKSMDVQRIHIPLKMSPAQERALQFTLKDVPEFLRTPGNTLIKGKHGKWVKAPFDVHTPFRGREKLHYNSVEQDLNPSKVESKWAVGGTETPPAKEVTDADAFNERKLLDRYRIDADEPIAVTLAFMSLEDRNAFLELHYPKRKKWAAIRSKRPTPSELMAWADQNFPDRNDLGLVQSDLKHLDKDAYGKLMEWSRSTSTVKLPRALGFPVKDEKFSATIAKHTPTAKEVQKSVKSESPHLGKMIRRYQRGQYHIKKMDLL